MRADGRTRSSSIQREVVLILAWGPAILLQLAHPLVAQGVADHSTVRAEAGTLRRRFRNTLDAMLRISFGPEDETRGAIGRINVIHDRVHGRLVETAGVFAEGTPYSAHDAALLTWVHATLLAMNLRVYELCVADLSPAERDRYCAEASAIEPFFGIPSGRLPRGFAQLQAYMDEMLGGGEIVVTETARALARAIFYPPLPWGAGVGMRLIRLPSLGLLPPTVREAYGFAWGAADERMFHRCAGLVHGLLPFVPPSLRYWRASVSDRCPRRMPWYGRR